MHPYFSFFWHNILIYTLKIRFFETNTHNNSNNLLLPKLAAAAATFPTSLKHYTSNHTQTHCDYHVNNTISANKFSKNKAGGSRWFDLNWRHTTHDWAVRKLASEVSHTLRRVVWCGSGGATSYFRRICRVWRAVRAHSCTHCLATCGGSEVIQRPHQSPHRSRVRDSTIGTTTSLVHPPAHSSDSGNISLTSLTDSSSTVFLKIPFYFSCRYTWMNNRNL